MNFKNLLASRSVRMESNAIRDILKVLKRPGMISLAGGIPAPESFPMEIIQDLITQTLDRYSSGAFQYDLTEGFPPLRQALSLYLKEQGIKASADEIFISSGSQGVLDGIAKVLISKGDCIAVEAPTYIGAISAFNPYEPEYVRMDMDEDGLIPDSLDRVLKSREIKFIYLVPTFQNPTGRTISFKRRKAIAGIIKRHGALLLEDDPYAALRYRGKHIPPIKTLAPDNVIYVGTFSKVFAPGLRVGFFTAPKPIDQWLVLVKQGVDLHTSTFNQALAAGYLTEGHLKRHLPNIVKIYKPKQEAMLEAMDRYFPDSFNWSRPEGGMFIWAEGPAGFDMENLYWKSVERNIAFVPGRFFYTSEAEGMETMRLNFTNASEEVIHSAIKTLSQVIRAELKPRIWDFSVENDFIDPACA